MSSAQAAAALGVKPSTLYAYVSRGVIARHVDVVAGRRASRFRRDEVVALAEQRSRPRSGALTTLIESDVSQLDVDGVLAFRGVDLDECVRRGFEWTAAHVLGDHALAWPGSGPDRHGTAAITPSAVPVAAGVSGVSVRTTDSVRWAVMAGAGADPYRSVTSPEHCRQVAVSVVGLAIEAITSAEPSDGSSDGPPSPDVSGSVAARLAHHWCGAARPTVGDAAGPTGLADWQVGAVDTALTVLVDHELTASTLAARAAAGVRADPWMVLLTGLAAMSGPGQSGASRSALTNLRQWRDGALPDGERVAGFGHKIYLGPDPRAELVLAALADPTQGRPHEVLAAVDGLAIHVARTRGLYPNMDLALAALIDAADLPDDAGEVIFTIARIPGLMAHAIEEYPHGLRLRPRALS